MKDQEVSSNQRWAQFRLQVIGPLLASPAEPGALQEAIRELADRALRRGRVYILHQKGGRGGQIFFVDHKSSIFTASSMLSALKI